MSKHFQENKKDLNYYLTLYHLKGHTTWRAHLSGHAGGFTNEQKAWAQGPNPPEVTEKQVLIIDRITGTFKV